MKKMATFATCSAILLGGCLEAGTDTEITETPVVSGTVTADVSGSVDISRPAQASTSTTSSLQDMVQSIYGLGPCNPSTEGSAAYVVDEECYYQCSGGIWSEQKASTSIENTCSIYGNGSNNVVFCGDANIGTLVIGGSSALDTSIATIVGKDGKDGIDGKDGRDGIDGKDGIDGVDGKDGADGKDGSSCTVEVLADNSGYKILCGGDSVGVLLHGLNGVDGKDGRDGVDGKDGRDGIDGKDGVDGKDGHDGKDGRDGVDGKDGRDGVDGKDCNCCDTVKITKKSWENLNPDIEYCQFQDVRDSQWYKCVVIGDQTWMAENLNYAGTVTESWCYKNQDSNCEIYGRLYTWAAAANLSSYYNNNSAGISSKHQGACPAGWHLPTNAEWNTLHSYVTQRNSQVGTALLSKTYDGTDEFGFSAMLAGNWKSDLIDRSDYFDNMNWVADFWTATESSYSAIRRNIGYYDSFSLNSEYEEKYEWGYSVRCVKD